MADFVDKIKKQGKEYEIHDTTGRVKIGGTGLVIPEQEGGPEPIITIDGVGYYHKQEFDLEELIQNESGTGFDLQTGESFQLTDGPTKSCLNIRGYGPDKKCVSLGLKGMSSAPAFDIQYIVNQFTGYEPANYASRSFTVVDTMEEVADTTKICLPTCSAYYGFLSEDGNTFISYFNLKGEGTSEYIDFIKQGNSTIPLHGKDERLPSAEQSDAGKVLKVADAGGYELGEVEAGSHVYKHEISVLGAGVSATFYLINNVSTAYTSTSDLEQNYLYNEIVPVVDVSGVGEPASDTSVTIKVNKLWYSSSVHALKLCIGSITYNSNTPSTTAQYKTYAISSVSDTVTAL